MKTGYRSHKDTCIHFEVGNFGVEGSSGAQIGNAALEQNVVRLRVVSLALVMLMSSLRLLLCEVFLGLIAF